MTNKPLLGGAPESEGKAANLLTSLGCSPPLRSKVQRRLFQPALFLLIAVVLIVVSLWIGPLLGNRNPELGTNNLIVAIGNLIVAMSILLGISKWHTSLEQDAMKQYEGEIAEGNVAGTPDAVRAMMKHLYQPPDGESQNYDKSRYVYVQLDNLEYALERYMQGFASAYTTSRAVMTFASRCVSKEFGCRALRQVTDASYSQVVTRVVKAVVSRVPADERIDPVDALSVG